MERMMGAADVDVVSGWLDEAAANPAVEKVLLFVNSPGGTVTGVEELASKVANFAKPTRAFADNMAASAGYWVASQADEFVVTPSAAIGSIGVYMVIPNLEQYYADQGIKFEVIAAGIHKAAGAEGLALTEEQRAYLQASVESTRDGFRAAVLNKRRYVQTSDMEGQVFTGREAAQKGLATGVVSSFNDALNSFAGMPVSSTSLYASANKSGKKAMISKKATELDDSVLKLLTPRQKEMVDGYIDVEELFGEFDQTSGPDGSHYSAVSPFAADGLLCQNCVFYRGPRGCGLVAGDIDPNGICKLWVIPGIK
jgi:signal peptide peptidase SppA